MLGAVVTGHRGPRGHAGHAAENHLTGLFCLLSIKSLPCARVVGLVCLFSKKFSLYVSYTRYGPIRNYGRPQRITHCADSRPGRAFFGWRDEFSCIPVDLPACPLRRPGAKDERLSMRGTWAGHVLRWSGANALA